MQPLESNTSGWCAECKCYKPRVPSFITNDKKETNMHIFHPIYDHHLVNPPSHMDAHYSVDKYKNRRREDHGNKYQYQEELTQ
jgi:hypothetical protein